MDMDFLILAVQFKFQYDNKILNMHLYIKRLFYDIGNDTPASEVSNIYYFLVN